MDESVEANAEETHEAARASLQKAVSNYVANCYQSELSAGSVYARDGRLFVCIAGEKINLKTFWSGRWTSTWALTVTGSTVSVSGDIKVFCWVALCLMCVMVAVVSSMFTTLRMAIYSFRAPKP